MQTSLVVEHWFRLARSITVAMLLASPWVAHAQVVIFADDFESGLGNWVVEDTDAEYGVDTWGISDARANGGSYSVWCAQVGVDDGATGNGLPNADNGYYDNNMSADMRLALGDLSAYSSVTLRFAVWYHTGQWLLYDYLRVWALVDGTWDRLYKQPNLNSSGWKTVSLSVPTNATELRFHFISDPTTGNGPYEGVYVDDVVLEGVPMNNPPVADAGSQQQAGEGVTVTLDGTQSSDPDANTTLTYSWTQTAGPGVLLNGASTATPTFQSPTVLADTTLTFELVVSDGSASSSDTVDVVILNDVNEPPVAHAGDDRTVDEDSLVTLDASLSSDPNDDAITGHAWSQVSGPSVMLSDATAASPTFTTPPVSGAVQLVFELVVTDALGATSLPASVTLTINDSANAIPIAHAGSDQAVDEDAALVTLDGSLSSDADGNTLLYAWTQVGTGPLVTLIDANTVAPTFVPPSVVVDTTLTFRLIVNDGAVDSLPDTVIVTVRNTVNDPPIASAGDDLTVGESAAVSLDGSASADPNGEPLTHAWVQTGGPSVTLSGADGATPSFTSPRVYAATTLTFELTVRDPHGATHTDQVSVVVSDSINEPPTADAGSPLTVGEEATVTLDGTASADPNGDALVFSWTQLEGPAVTLSDAAAATPDFVSPRVTAPTSLVFELTVSDGELVSSPVTITVYVDNDLNEAPLAFAGNDQVVGAGALVMLDGDTSLDPNGDALSYTWTQVSGTPVVLSDPTSATPTFEAPDVASTEDLVFSLVVSDGSDSSAPVQVTIQVLPQSGPPIITSVPRRIAFLGEAYLYDRDGVIEVLGERPLSFSVGSGPPGFAVDAATGAVTWTPSAGGPAPITLRVSNAAGSTEQLFTVQVYDRPVILSSPSTTFLLGAPYRYDADGVPEALGTPPLYWTLAAGPNDMVVRRDSGELLWTPTDVEPVTVTLRVTNAYGSDEQTFTLGRQLEEAPHIVRSANRRAAVGVPYRYDDDGKVEISGAEAGEAIWVAAMQPSPDTFFVWPTTRDVTWIPQAAGTVTVRLVLVVEHNMTLDEYEFQVEVDDPSQMPANAVAIVTPNSGLAPLTVALDGSQSQGAGGAPVYVLEWDTGDGQRRYAAGHYDDDGVFTPAAAVMQHVFTAPGGYTVTLDMVDTLGFRDSDKVFVGVATEDNQPPYARIVADNLHGRDELTVRFECDCADPDGEIQSILWEYGDGDSSTLPRPVHRYLNPGSYRARLTVFDDKGLPASDNVEIVVTAGELHPPSARVVATPADGDNPLRVGLGADVEDVDGTVVAYRWLMPDGTTRTEPTFVETFTAPGYYTVTLFVQDNDGLEGRDAMTLYVRANGMRPPRIVSQPNQRAYAGAPYRYDEDGLASAQGDRPLGWRLGKVVDGSLVNAPEGMTIDFSTGEIVWTPAANQVGAHRVTLLAENDAGADLQEFVIEVASSETTSTASVSRGCACRSTGGGSFTIVVLLAALRRRRRGWLAACLGLSLIGAGAQAAPSITSQPITTAAVGYPWSYDDDGLPAAVGVEPLEWSLVAAPANMAIDNVTGELYWVPDVLGAVTVRLAVTDGTGTVEQEFDIDVQDALAPQILVTPPDGGFVVPAGVPGLLEGYPAIPASGTPPVYLFVEPVHCFHLAAGGMYAVSSVFPGDCTVRLHAANWVGDDELELVIHFVDPASGPGAQLDAVLNVDRLEGNAPLTIYFDGSQSSTPPTSEGWTTFATLVFGDAEGIGDVGGLSGTLLASHVYERPGVYEASLILTSKLGGALGDIVGLVSSDRVTIVVGADDLRPPVPQLVAMPDHGDAPITVQFASATELGDGTIAHYLLDYGDGDRYEVAVPQDRPFSDPTVEHVYLRPSWYTARLTVTSSHELAGRSEVDVIVLDEGRVPPFARGFATPARGEVPLEVTLLGEAGDLDGLVVARYWILPDGGIRPVEEGSGAALPKLTLSEPGEHVVKFVVQDDDGLTSTANVLVQATKDGVLPPRIVSTPRRDAWVGQPYEYDDDGAALALGGGPYRWSVGKSVAGNLVNAPAGFTIDERSGAVTWTPSAEQVGDVSVTLLVENVAGVAMQEFTIAVADEPDAAAHGANPTRAGCDCDARGGAQSALWAVGLVWLLLRRRR